MRTLLTLTVLVYIWLVGFHDGHNPEPDPVRCKNGELAMLDWYGYTCREAIDDRDDRANVE